MMPAIAVPNPKTLLLAGLALGALAGAASAQDMRFRDGRFFETQGGVTLQRSDEAASDEAVRNTPFLPGDRVWTDDSGRAEILFAEGEILWIAERSKVDSLGRGGREQDERLGLRVFAGSFGARVRSGGPGFEFRAPGGSLTTTGAAAFRVDVRAGETVVSVSEGEVLADFTGRAMTVRAGERIRYADRTVDGPFMYRRASTDSFDRWCDERAAELNRMAANRDDERLPDELDSYGEELEQNGDWVYDEPQGYVYVPRVAYDWAPYTYGRWTYTHYGWTWVADEPWGFVTSHYGRWGYSSRIGWHWMPRPGFAGAWVSWSTPVGRWGDTIGWCALGFNDRPVGSFAYGSGGRAVRRGSARADSAGRGWSFANRSDIGRADIHRRRVALPADAVQSAVVWNAGASPDRQLRQGTPGSGRVESALSRRGSGIGEAAGAIRRGEDRSGGGADNGARIYVRPSPGDSTPELRSDPATTLPSPESRRGRTIGQDGFKDEQDNRRNRARPNTSTPSAGRAEVTPAADSSRLAPAGRGVGGARPTARPEADNEAERTESSREAPRRDPLLRRFFRSITSSRPDRDTDSEATPRGDDASARRRQTPPREEGSARESSPREQPRPTEARPSDRGRSRPTGVGQSQPRQSPPRVSQPRKSQPRKSPAPKPSPREGGSEAGQAAKHRPPADH